MDMMGTDYDEILYLNLWRHGERNSMGKKNTKTKYNTVDIVMLDVYWVKFFSSFEWIDLKDPNAFSREISDAAIMYTHTHTQKKV